MVKIVVFDAFNTLVKRNRKFIFEPYKLVTKRATKELFNPMGTNLSIREYADAIGSVYSKVEMDQIESDLALEISKITIFDEVLSVMSSLIMQGYVTAIASNLAPAYGPILKELFTDYVHEYYYSYEIGYSKPNKEFYSHIMDDCAVKYDVHSPDQFFMVGDNEVNDYKAPAEFGWSSMLLDRKAKKPHSISRLNSIFLDLNYRK